MSWPASFRTAARYTWTRVRRSWWLPAAATGGLATGLVTVTQTVAETGAGVLQQAAQFLAFLQVGVMVLAGLAADPERDEDSAAVLWSWPVDKAALVLGKFAGTAPLALLAALGAVVPPAVRMAILARSAGLPWGYVLAEWGLLTLWIVSGALWAGVLGGALGLGLRGLPLFAAILATWLAGLVGPYVFQSLVRPFIPVAWLLQWTGSGMLPGDWQDVALAALAEDVPLFVAHRVLYLAAAGVVVVTLALAYRRRRWVKTRVRWGLRMTAAALVLLTLASSAGFVATLYAQADAARAELLHYARNGVASLYAGPEPDPAPPFAISRYELDVDARRAPEVVVHARLRLENRGREAVEDPVLTLRHVFTVTRLEVMAPGGDAVRWSQEGDVIRIQGLVLPPRGAATVALSYRGRVDQWLLPFEYPPVRTAGMTIAPPPMRGAQVGPASLSLPPSYGWYPLPGAVTLARVLATHADPDGGGQEVWWFGEGPDRTSADVIRWAGVAAPRPPYVPESLRASFQVTVRHAGRYPVLSNLQTVERPWGPVTVMRGTTAFLELVGGHLVQANDSSAEIWYSPEDLGSRDDALRWARDLVEAYRWVGRTVRPRVVTLPPGRGDAHWVHLDPDTGTVIERGSNILVPQQVAQAVLYGRREVAGDAEGCLLAVLADVVGASSGRTPAGPPFPTPGGDAPTAPGAGGAPPQGPCENLPNGPRYEEVQRWLLGTPRSEVTARLSRLRELAARRPLTAADLREVMTR